MTKCHCSDLGNFKFKSILPEDRLCGNRQTVERLVTYVRLMGALCRTGGYEHTSGLTWLLIVFRGVDAESLTPWWVLFSRNVDMRCSWRNSEETFSSREWHKMTFGHFCSPSFFTFIKVSIHFFTNRRPKSRVYPNDPNENEQQLASTVRAEHHQGGQHTRTELF